MITIRKAEERGHFDHGWLDTYHTFSFGSYYEPEQMGFRSLRVINDDIIAGSMGFGTHGHADMEIITYVLDGELAHKDSTGGGGVLYPGDVQHMTAGSGVRHSEFNNSKSPARIIQVWILPEKRGLTPSYEQTYFTEEERTNGLRLVAAGDPKAGSLKVRQDIKLFATLLEKGKQVAYDLDQNRYGWIQVAKGSVALNGQTLKAGDGAAISKESKLEITGTSDERAEFLLFDLA
jgi:redox-sensitive bicupin YhaK (pirin superfamily)